MPKIVIELRDDGSIAIDSSKADGTPAEILSRLEALAKSVGGELAVEKHVHSNHVHEHHHLRAGQR